MPYYLSKVFISVEKVDGFFVNIPDPIIKKINASPLHDNYSLLACKSNIPSIFKTLNIIVITKYVYTEFESSRYDDRHVETIINQFQFFQTTS